MPEAIACDTDLIRVYNLLLSIRLDLDGVLGCFKVVY